MGCIGPLFLFFSFFFFQFCVFFFLFLFVWFCWIFFCFVFVFCFFFYKLILSRGRERSGFSPPFSKIYKCQEKKTKAIGLVSGFFTKNSWPSPKGPEVCLLPQKGGVLTATRLRQHWEERGKQCWIFSPSLALPSLTPQYSHIPNISTFLFL